ncbi:hypothetical protein FOL47_008579 [Perkinsus chesapeaki]|uniref:DNA/RNA-binding protein Alba-like domain-containing protein n=1 Tax=Perkinsus chesapeaki TaxID=330153 RepID=A0A7J6LD15_PERCH|nr:hypothetical protein FOL47_008579 [Perkinsus chesapeaki]
MTVSTENTKPAAAEAAAPSTPEKKVATVVPEAQSTGVTEKVVTSPVAKAEPTAALNPSKRYRRVQRNREEKDDQALAHEVRITVSGGVGLFVKEGVRKLLDTTEGIPEIKVMARGPAIAKAVIVSEMINRMIPDLEQDVELGSTDVNDEYVSVDETHETVIATRIVPFLVVTITHPKGLIDKSTVSRRPRNTRVPIATKADIAAIKEKKATTPADAAADQVDEAAASKKKARKNTRRNRSNRSSAKATTDEAPMKSENAETEAAAPAKKAETAAPAKKAEVAAPAKKAEVAAPAKKAETAAPAKKAEAAAPAKKAETAAPAKKAEAAAPAKKGETAAPAKKAVAEVEKEPSAFDGAVKPRSK